MACRKRSAVLLAIFATFVATAPAEEHSPTSQDAFDTSVAPGDDFFQYVNGQWLKANPIPAAYGNWSIDSELREHSETNLRAILDGLGGDKARLPSEQRKLRDAWTAATDEANLEKQGIAPLADELARIAAVKQNGDLPALLAQSRARGLEYLFSFWVDQDEKQSDRYAIHLGQGGILLPERSYYFDQTDAAKHIRDEYTRHIEKMLTLLGDTPDAARDEAAAVLRIETQLAEASRAPADLRDPITNYNRKTLAELEQFDPAMHWKAYLQTAGAESADSVIVGQPEFFKRLDEVLQKTPVEELKTCLRWELTAAMARYLPTAFDNESFHFQQTVLLGVKEMKPRWKRALSTLDWQLGEALGKLYVEKYFPPSAKAQMDELVANLKAAYRARILTRDWMGEQTRQRAVFKLERITAKIGYPSKWRDYADLKVSPTSYCQNALYSADFDFHYRMGRLNKPVDRSEWDMTPPTINAYYQPTNNEIVFPAGILQPPYFDAKQDGAYNYGSIGAVIGHEMTHGFDDEGSQSDADGNLKDWWTPEDRERFRAKTARLVAQFNACVAVDNQHLNGELTLGENLADLGGLMIAYDAYIKSLDGKTPPTIDGLTGPQRFFMGYARSWRGHTREAAEKVQIRTDPHAPERFRVLMPLSNCPAFYEAFGVKPGDKMYRKPEDRVEVW